MTPATRFRRIDELFRAASQVNAGERGAFLDEQCRDDAELRGEVLSLLNEDGEPRGVLDRPAFRATMILSSVSAGEAGGAPLPIPEMIGRYRIVRELGRGGMGVVYEAIQQHPRRTVALKVIHASLATPTMLRRFQRESELLGRLQHPGIEAIFEAGSFDTGGGAQPFFAMELVHGRPLNDFADEAKLNRHERLELIARVCDAVDHAHQRGVIHRDLKPSNVLVDAAGQPHVLDFGIARATDVDVQTVTMQTDAGQLLGTIPYMSPEQAAGDPRQIDSRSDVYSIGVMAYELLAGRLPHDIGHRLVHEAVRIIREDEPTRLSSIDRSLRGDVETIIGKALEKEKTRRYQSAAELARDIRRYLADQPITARPASAVYQLRKFARRNKAIVGGVAVAFVAMILGTTVAVRQAFVAEQARRDAVRLQGVADERAAETERQVYRMSMVAASSAMRYHDTSDAARHLNAAPVHLRGWEAAHLQSRVDDSLARADAGFVPMCLAMSHDGSLVASSSSGGNIRIWNAEDFSLIARVNLVGKVFERRPYQLAFSPDGSVIRADATLGSIHIDTATFQEIERDKRPTIARSKDGRVGVWKETRNGEQALAVHDLSEGIERLSISGPDLGDLRLQFSEDGMMLAVGLRGGRGLLVYGVEDGRLLCHRPNLDQAADIAFAPDNALAATMDRSGNIHVFDPRDGRDVTELQASSLQVTALAFVPGNQLIATGSADGTVRLWRLSNAKVVSVMHGNPSRVVDLLCSPDGKTFVSASANGGFLKWDATMTSDPFVLPAPGSVYGVAISPDGELLAAACLGGDRPLCIWDLQTGEERFRGLDGHLSALAFSRDGQKLVAGRTSGGLSVIRTADGSVITSLRGHDWRTDWVHVSADQSSVLSLGNGGDLVSHDMASRSRIRSIKFASNNAADGCRGAISPDGSTIVIASKKDIHLLDAKTWEKIGILDGHTDHVYALAFNSDGSRLVSGSRDRTLRVWNMADRSCLATLEGHTDEIFAAAFSPDGTRLVSGGRDRVVRVWDAQRFEEITQLHGHTSFVYSLAFAPDGLTVASGGGDGTVRLWTTTPLREFRSPRSSSGLD